MRGRVARFLRPGTFISVAFLYDLSSAQGPRMSVTGERVVYKDLGPRNSDVPSWSDQGPGNYDREIRHMRDCNRRAEAQGKQIYDLAVMLNQGAAIRSCWY